MPRAPGGNLPLRVPFDLAVFVRVRQRRHELASKHLGQRVHREQEVGLASGRRPMAFLGKRAASHHRVQMDMALQILRPGVQYQAECGSAVCVIHPLVAGGKLRQCLRRTGEQGVDHPAGMRAIQAVEAVRQGKHQVGVRHRQYFGQTTLQPGVFGPCTALRAMPVPARMVLPVTMVTGIARQLLPAQRGGATRNNAPPGFFLRCVQGVLFEKSGSALPQRICQSGSHGALTQWSGCTGGIWGNCDNSASAALSVLLPGRAMDR